MPKILIAVDGSALSLDAVHHALALVDSGLRAEFVLANVQEPASLYELVVSRDPDRIAAASLEAGAHLMASARALLDAAGLSYETEIGIGDPAHTLVDLIESTGSDMAIVGARGQGAIRSALLGSVSQALVHASPVPVTIVRHAPDAAQAQDVLESDSGADVLENFRGA
ncbi:universal stress protein [Simplicispira suum]|uniref:Universal stress protein UspA n=1 Tax=Simplicispira suum TaxID=2109915 RepID=A0A2S0MY03_9BURK|nr:universal stress protein [Simplicispira suum]AVO40770.1 universal stress protein UspA [Simplicispira suum]